MAAFKQHVSFGFWKGQLMGDPHGLFQGVGKTTIAALRAENLSDLPSDAILIHYVKEAVELNKTGVKKPPSMAKRAEKELEVPEYLLAELKKNEKALATFESSATATEKSTSTG